MKPLDASTLLRMAKGRPVHLFLDFDGTLAAHRTDGRYSRLADGVQETLRRLARKPGWRVSVISGRPIDDLRPRIGLRSVVYGGNHGLAISGPDVSFAHPLRSVIRAAMNAAASLIRGRVRSWPRAVVDHNRLTLSLNIGEVPAPRRRGLWRVVDELRDELRWLRLRWQEGHMGWDLLPDVGWDKGSAVAHLLKPHPRAFALAAGDGFSDEAMFTAIRGRGAGVRVGPAVRSAARWSLRGPDELARLLAGLA